MGRGQGRAATVVVPRCRGGTVSCPLPGHKLQVSIKRSEDALVRLLKTPDFLRLAEVGDFHTRQISAMLEYGCPTHWILDCCLGEANEELYARPEMQSYLEARLLNDSPLLVQDGLLSEKEARGLDAVGSLTFPVLCTADLIRARRDLQGVESEYEEGRRARDQLIRRCTEGAERMMEVKRAAYIETLSLLAYVRSFTKPTWASERRWLYGGGSLERARQLLSEAGIESNTPVIFCDFAEIGAVTGIGAIWKRMKGAGGGLHGMIMINRKERASMQKAHAQGRSSVTLVHELIHTAQVKNEEDLACLFSNEYTIAERTLNRTLCEGATEAEARFLVNDPNHYNDEDCIAYVAFVMELAWAAKSSAEEARALVGCMARARHSERALLASREFLGSEAHVGLLTEAAYRYVGRCIDSGCGADAEACRALAVTEVQFLFEHFLPSARP